MLANENDKNNNIESNPPENKMVTLLIPKSDFMYGEYRRSLIEYYNRPLKEREKEPVLCGFVLNSKRTGEGNFEIAGTGFGDFEEQLTALSVYILRFLNQNLIDDKEQQEQVLLHFLRTFIGQANDIFFEKGYLDDDELIQML